jgi:SAM-dependent methyltransferase
MTEVIDYYAEDGLSAVFYDFISSRDPTVAGDVDFYESLAPNGSFLELGCGTGRVSLELAARGHEVVGVDLAPAMVNRAEMKRQRHATPEAAARATFLLGDMTAVRLDRRFDAVIVPFFSFAHLPLQLRPAGFKAIAAHLKSGGVAALHMPLPDSLTGLEHGSDGVVLDVEFAAGRRLVVRLPERRYDAAAAQFHQVVEYTVLDSAGAVERRSRERMTYYVGDLIAPAAAAGLKQHRPMERFNDLGEMWLFELA